MLKLLKIIAALLAFSFIALLTIPFFVDVNDYKPEIKQAVKEATGRSLDIEHIELSLFPWVGVTLQNVQLENAHEFQQPYMLSVKSIDVQVELLPLLNQKVEVKRFELNTPQIWLTQKEDGSNNWQDLQQTSKQSNSPTAQPSPKVATPQANASSTKAAEPTPATTPPIAFNAKLLSLNDGQVIWKDESKGEIIVSDIQLQITDLQLEQPIGIDLSAKLGGDDIHVHAKVGPILDLNKLDLLKLPLLVQVQSQKLRLAPLAPWLPELDEAQTAQLGSLSDANISMDISVEQHADSILLSSGSLQFQSKNSLKAAWKINAKALKSLHIERLKLALDDVDVLTASGKVKGLQTRPRFEARIETSKLQRIWLNQFIPALQDVYKDHPKPWQTIKLASFIAGDADILEIRNLQLELNDEPIQMSGDVALGNAPDVQLRVTAGELHLDPWIPQTKEEEQTTAQTDTPPAPASNNGSADNTTAIQEAVEPDLTFLKPWYLSVQLNAKAIHAMNLRLDNLRMTLSAEKGVVRLNPLSFDIGNGQVTENFTLYANQYPATWKESLKMSGVSVQPILKAVADFDKLSGIAQLNTDLSGKGLLPKSITQSLKGRGNFVFEDGQFKGVDIAKTVRELTKKKKQPQSSTDFAQMQGSFHVKNGVVTNNDLYMASPLFRMTGKGKIYLDPMAIDYRVRPRLIQSLKGQGGGQNNKGIVVPLHIKGPFDDLDISVKMDKDSLLDSAAAINKATGNKVGGVAGKVLDQGYVKTRDEEVKKAKEKLKQKVAAEKKRAEEAAKKKAEQKLKDALKGFKF